MMGRDRLIRLCSVLILLNLCFIWGNSLLPAEVSQAFSDWVKSLLEAVFPSEEALPSDGGLLRKAAHFAEFAALGFLVRWRAVLLRKKGIRTLLWGVAAACVDETIQIFVPGRGPGILDVGIDTCGVVTGMILLQIGYVLWKQHQSKQYGGKQ